LSLRLISISKEEFTTNKYGQSNVLPTATTLFKEGAHIKSFKEYATGKKKALIDPVAQSILRIACSLELRIPRINKLSPSDDAESV